MLKAPFTKDEQLPKKKKGTITLIFSSRMSKAKKQSMTVEY